MLRKITLPVILAALAFGLWRWPQFHEIAAGLALLLLGMMMLEEGFNAFTDGPLEQLLRRFTDKLYKGVTVGAVATAFLQSSSLISVIVISFISAGLMSLRSGIGVVYGANIGTTATAWIVSAFGLDFKISGLALPMIVIGILFFFQKVKKLKGLGKVLTGLGLFFLGIHYMKEGFNTFESKIDIEAYSMPGIAGVLTYTGLGILLTVLVQSSSASLALILTALAAGHISYMHALSFAIGANIGTTITAILGSLSANISGKRLAAAHFIFNLVTGIFAISTIPLLAKVVDFLALQIGIADGNYSLKLSLFHTIFNVIGVIIMLPMTNYLVRKLELILKEKPDQGIEYPRFLNNISLNYTPAAIESLLNESKNLFQNATFEIVAHGFHLHRDDIISERKLKDLVRESRETMDVDVDEFYYRKVKVIYSKIIEYACLIQEKHIGKRDVETVARIKIANRYIVECIKNVRGLHANIAKFMFSENEHIRKEYDKLRKIMSKVLREVYLTRKDEHPHNQRSRLKALKIWTAKKDVLTDGTLDHLIRTGAITSEMATSLANDSEAVAHISKHLIDAALLLYSQSDTLLESYGDQNGNEEQEKDLNSDIQASR
jgi:phosphate:Na+ symporter